MNISFHHITYLDIMIIQHIIFALLMCVLLRMQYIDEREDHLMKKSRNDCLLHRENMFLNGRLSEEWGIRQKMFILYYFLSFIFGFFAFIFYLIKNKKIKV